MLASPLLPTAKASMGGCQRLGEVCLPGTFLRGTVSLQNTAPSMLPTQCTPKAALEITSTHLMPSPTETHDESNEKQLQSTKCCGRIPYL